ncbi:MAG: NAD(P)/FAD-dependent oxidoreductase [Nevskiaceae bacterium]|nr:MAG: NAD(P)/FAD-dependent oxidoreductase [Nevskiaceae bacterium]
MDQIFDVLIIGAGISGIGTACHLARECPDKKVGIIERRERIGGTWDLFRYPGIRSDTDMISFCYKFRLWDQLKVMADGPALRQYINDTAREFGVDKKVQFGLKTTAMDWSSQDQCWTVSTTQESTGEVKTFRAKFLVCATGYYNYDQGYLPTFPGQDLFKGLRIHPQHWPENLDYSGKRVVVIGSGATAVTVVPAMTDKAAHVTMLQRSPSYIFSLPNHDKVTAVLQKILPKDWAYRLARKRNILVQRAIYLASRRWPEKVRAWLLNSVRKQLGPNADMSHFTPRYMPWDERLCASPDGDLFAAIRAGKASVVTDHIETFNETGIRLKSGKQLDADIIVTATGLQIQLLGGAELLVDHQPRPISRSMTYKGVLIQDVPNLAWIFGYTNAPWTLKADLSSGYICRLLKEMDARGMRVVTPRAPAGEMETDNILGSLGSGYVQRGQALLPRQGRGLPWRVLHHYGKDIQMMANEPVDDGSLEFVPAASRNPVPSALAA